MKFAILAAGEGSRLAQEGIELPKPLVRLLGEPMLDRLIRIFMSNGASEIVLITNNLTPLTQAHVRQLQAQGLPLRMVVRTTPSSMHSFHALRPLLGEGRFCLTTVDTVFREDEFAAYVRTFAEAPAELDGLMAVTDYVDDERPLWLSTDEAMRVTGFHDSQQDYAASAAAHDGHSSCHFISGGIYGLSHTAFPTLDRCIEQGQSRMRNFQRALVADGLHLQAWPFSKILDVDHASDIAKAEAFLSQSQAAS